MTLPDEPIDEAVRDPDYRPPVPESVAVDPWLERRRHGFGGSDLPALFVLLGRMPEDSAPGYVRDNARAVRKGSRLGPRLLLEKAGFAKPLAVGASAAIGSAREPELLEAWKRTLSDSLVDPESVRHSTSVPRGWFPLVDRECPRLAITPDAWAADIFGEQLVVELKCSRYYEAALPWYWMVQVQAQIAVMGAAAGVVVLGRGWSMGMDADGPVHAWGVERDPKMIAEIRSACLEGWARVEALKEMGQ